MQTIRPALVIITADGCPPCNYFKANLEKALVNERLTNPNDKWINLVDTYRVSLEVRTIENLRNLVKREGFHPELTDYVSGYPAAILFTASSWLDHSIPLDGAVYGGIVNRMGKTIRIEQDSSYKFDLSYGPFLQWLEKQLTLAKFGPLVRAGSSYSSSNGVSNGNITTNGPGNIPGTGIVIGGSGTQSGGGVFESTGTREHIKMVPTGNPSPEEVFSRTRVLENTSKGNLGSNMNGVNTGGKGILPSSFPGSNIPDDSIRITLPSTYKSNDSGHNLNDPYSGSGIPNPTRNPGWNPFNVFSSPQGLENTSSRESSGQKISYQANSPGTLTDNSIDHVTPLRGSQNRGRTMTNGQINQINQINQTNRNIPGQNGGNLYDVKIEPISTNSRSNLKDMYQGLSNTKVYFRMGSPESF